MQLSTLVQLVRFESEWQTSGCLPDFWGLRILCTMKHPIPENSTVYEY